MTDPAARIATVSPEFARRQRHRRSSPHRSIWQLLDQVCDPEMPGVTLWDLGILQDVESDGAGWRVSITPTYSGCPAVDTLKADIVQCLAQAGYQSVRVKIVLSPAWTTQMISPAGEAQLKRNFITPPQAGEPVCCAHCGSDKTHLVSQFGSTACKALYQCDTCLQPFDYFKPF